MNKRELRKKVYTDNDRGLSFRLAVLFRIYSVRPVKEPMILNFSKRDKIIYFFEKRHNLYNPLTWIYFIVLTFLNILILFISDFLVPLVEGIAGIPREIKATQHWDKCVLSSEYKEVSTND